MTELRALHLLSKWGSGGSAAVLLFTPWRERRGDQLSSSLTPGLLLLLFRAPAASCERCPDGAANGTWRLGSSSGPGGGGDGDGLLSWNVSLSPVDPWWRGAGASRSNWAKVSGRRALRLTQPRGPIMGVVCQAIRPRMRSPCVVTLSPAFLPLKSHPPERHVTGRCEQEEPSSVQVVAAVEEEGGEAAGGDFGRTRRRGFVFATMKTRIGLLLTLHGSVRPIN